MAGIELRDWFRGPDQWPDGLEEVFAYVPPEERERSQQRTANIAFVASEYGKAPRDVAKVWDTIRPGLSNAYFGLEGDPGDAGFYQEAGRRFDKIDAENAMFADPLKSPAAYAMETGMSLGGNWWEAYEAFKGDGVPEGWNPQNEPEYVRIFQEQFERAVENYEPIRAIADEIVTSLEKERAGKGDPKQREKLLESLAGLGDEQLEALPTIIARLVKEGGKAQPAEGKDKPEAKAKKGYFYSLAEEISRGAKDLGPLDVTPAMHRDLRAMDEILVSVDREEMTAQELWDLRVAQGFPAGKGPREGTPAAKQRRSLTDDEKERYREFLEDAVRKDKIATALRRVGDTIIDPAAEPRGWLARGIAGIGPGQEFRGMYPTMRQIPFSATGLIPYAGLPLIFLSERRFRYEEALDNGLSPEQADRLATTVTPFTAPIEWLQSKLLIGRTPFTKALANVRNTWLRRIGIGATAVGEQAILQNAQEALQDFIPIVAQEFSRQMPGVDWDARLSQYRQERVETFWALLPLVVIGSAGTTAREMGNFRAIDVQADHLQALNIPPEAARDIAAEMATNPKAAAGKLTGAYRAAQVERERQVAEGVIPPNGVTANQRQALDRLEVELDASEKSFEAIAQAQFPGVTLRKRAEGDYVVGLPGESAVQVDSLDAARVVMEGFGQTRATMQVAALRDLVTKYESMRVPGQTFEVMLEQEATAADMLKQWETEGRGDLVAALKERIGILERERGEAYDPSKVAVLGMNEGGLRGAIYKDVSRIRKGATILSVVEERSEGMFKRWKELGRYTREQYTGWVREYEQALGRTLLSESPSDLEVTEALSTIAVEFFTARASESGIVPELRRLLQQLLHYIEAVLVRGLSLSQAFKEGKLSGDFETALAEAVGIDKESIAAMETARAAEAEKTELQGEVAQETAEAPPAAMETQADLADKQRRFREAIGRPTKTRRDLVKVSELEAGDAITVGGEVLTVHSVEEQLDGTSVVHLRGGEKYGDQDIPADTAEVWVEKLEKGGEVSFSIGRAEDAAYLAAVERGDTAEAQRMVDAAAKGAGYAEGPLFHGTKEQFAAFDKRKIKSRHSLSFGFHFTSRLGEAVVYATDFERATTFHRFGGDIPLTGNETIVRAFLKAERPLIRTTDALGASVDIDNHKREIEHTLREAQERGDPYDSVIVHRVRGDDWDHQNVIVFDPNHIKSADPVTYDAQGNVVPLSQRFDPSRDEISFSIAPSAYYNTLYASLDARGQGNEMRAAVFAVARRRLISMRNDTDWNTAPVVQKVRRAIRELQAILSALPADARGVMSFLDAEGNRQRFSAAYLTNKMASYSTDKGRLRFLQSEAIPRFSGAIEAWLRRHYLERVEDLFKQGTPKTSATRNVSGGLAGDAERLVALAKDWAGKEAEEVELRIAGLNAAIEKARTEEEPEKEFTDGNAFPSENLKGFPKILLKLTEELEIAEMFGDLEHQDSSALEQAAGWLESVIAKGRTARRVIEEARMAANRGWAQKGVEALGRTDPATRHNRNINLADAPSFKSWATRLVWEILSFDNILDLLGLGEVRTHLRKTFRAATNQYTDTLLRRRLEMEMAMERILGTKGHLATWQRISELSKRDETPVEFLAGRKVERKTIDIGQAHRVVAGEIVVESEERAGIEAALLEFTALPAAMQGRKEKLHYDVVISPGVRQAQIMAPLEALYYMQFYRQHGYDEAAERYGIDAEARQQLEGWLASKYPEVLEIGGWLADQYEAGHAPLSKLHQQIHGALLPKVDFYAPGRVERMNDKSFLSGALMDLQVPVGSTNAGFKKSRVPHRLAPKQSNALSVYWAHVMQTEYWLAFAEPTRNARAILGNSDLWDAMRATVGSAKTAKVAAWLEVMETGGVNRGVRFQEFDQILTNMAQGRAFLGLAYNTSTIFKQGNAMMGAAIRVPAVDYMRGLAEISVDPKRYAEIFKSPTIQRRIHSGYSPEMRMAMTWHDATPTKTLYFLKQGTMSIALADAAFTTVSAAIAYDYHYRQAIETGMSEEAAKAIALEAMDDAVTATAQPAELMDRSLFENNAGATMRLLFMFRSEMRQKAAIAYVALANMARGQDVAQNAQAAFVVLVLMPAMTALMGANFALLIKGQPPEEAFDPKKFLATILRSQAGGVLFFGDVYEALVDAALKQEIWPEETLRAVSGSVSFANGVLKGRYWDDISEAFESGDVKDIIHQINRVAQQFSTVASAFRKELALPGVVTRIARDAWGLYDTTSSAVYDMIHPEVKMARQEEAEIMEEQKEASEARLAERDRIAALPGEERNAKLRKLRSGKAADKAMAQSVADKLERDALTKDEKAIQKYAVTGGYRARFIKLKLDRMKERDREPYLKRLKEVGLLSKTVQKQLDALK